MAFIKTGENTPISIIEPTEMDDLQTKEALDLAKQKMQNNIENSGNDNNLKDVQ